MESQKPGGAVDTGRATGLYHSSANEFMPIQATPGFIQPPSPTPPPQAEPQKPRCEGLGGWLIFPALGLVLAAVTKGCYAAVYYLKLFAGGKWGQLFAPESVFYHAQAKQLAIGEIAADGCIALAAVVLLFLFFARKRQFPMLMILYFAGSMAWVLIDLMLAWRISPLFQPDELDGWMLFGAYVRCAIWIPYFVVSRRVEATFTR